MTQPADFTRAAERHLPDTLDFLRALVGINSLTTNAPGIRQVARGMAEKFAALAFAPEFSPSSNPRYGDHLILRRPPVAGAPTIALITHLDTVYSAEEEAASDFAWRAEGTRIYGPGTSDIKGGTAAIYLLLLTLRDAAPAILKAANWVVLANACEETESREFGHLCRRVLPADTLAALIFEADGNTPDRPTLVEARKGRATFRVEVTGRSAHAGGAHAEGANAIVALASVISSLAALTDYPSGVTVNVGHITGGSIINRVPHHATADLEMRAFAAAPYQSARDRILAHSGNLLGCQVTVHLLDETPPWQKNPATDHLIAVWQEAGALLDRPVSATTRGGLSDGNVLWSDFPTLDGLGPSGENCHCAIRTPDRSADQEWVDATSFVPKTTLNALALTKLLKT